MQAYRYIHPNGMRGLGFIIDFAGRDMHSVAWELGPSARYKTDELESHGITASEIMVLVTEQGTEIAGDEVEIDPTDEVSFVATGPVPFDFNAEEKTAVNLTNFLIANPNAGVFDVIRAMNDHGLEVTREEVVDAMQSIASPADEGEAPSPENGDTSAETPDESQESPPSQASPAETTPPAA